MERSLAFVPRSVSRKPSQEQKTVVKSAKLKQTVADASVGKHVEKSAIELKQEEPEKCSGSTVMSGTTEACHTDSTYSLTEATEVIDLSMEDEDTVTIIKQTMPSTTQSNSATLGESQSSEPYVALTFDMKADKSNSKTEQTDPSQVNMSPQEVDSSALRSDSIQAPEQSNFSFSSFVETVCKHNNLYPSLFKENQPIPQITELKAGTSHQADTSEFSFSSFAEAVYKQSNLPLIDVGALSPRRKIPCFIRQRAPLGMLRQPVFDPVGSGPSMNRSFSGVSGVQGTIYAQETEPVRKRFKEHEAVKSRKQEVSFGFPREWELTQCGRQYIRKPKEQRGFDFTLMSYNVLAQKLLKDNMYLYTGCDQDVLDWKHRKKQLLSELKHHKPDVICLQEVQKSHYEDFFKPQLHKLGYDSAYVKRSGDKIDGCATFVNTSKFHIEKSVPVEYYHPKGGSVLDRDNVALIVKLKPISEHVPSDRRVCVANTHLLFNPKRGDVKLAQIMVLLAELDKCAYHGGSTLDKYHPVVLCGDFNSEPHCELYKLLIMNRLHYDGLLCRVLSGQQEGIFRGNNFVLEKDFMPPEVGISDNCQYLDVLKSRHSGFSINQTAGERSDPREDCEIEMTGSQGTGMLSHNFNLISVYNQKIARLRHRHSEITTYHNRAACTVDYIFYGVQYKETRLWNGEVEMRNVEESKLHLLGRYGLLADHELQEMGGLPNECLSSDHLSLLSKFLLK